MGTVYFMGDDKMAHLQRFGRHWLLGHRGLGLHSYIPASSMATFKMRPVAAADTAAGGENFFDRNKRLARPTSPHLTIYKMQLTAVLSITHRGTGLAQSALLSGQMQHCVRQWTVRSEDYFVSPGAA